MRGPRTMAPDLFEWVGLRAHGRGFEMVVWALVLLVGLALMWRERVAGRGLRDGVFGWLTGGGLVVFGVWRWFGAAVLGDLFFGPRGLVLPTYGVLMGVAFLVGTSLAFREAERTPGPPGGFGVIDLAFWLLISSLLGARLLFMVTRVDHYVALCTGEAGDCLAFLRIWEGGLVFYGGVLGAFAGGALWCRRRGVSFLRGADLFAPALAIGHAIGRLGCYAASCCYGARTHAAHGVHFPAWSSPFNNHLAAAQGEEREWLLEHMHSHAVIPVQLWEALGELAIFFVLILLVQPRKRYHGQVILTWAGLYAMLRFALEMVRDDAIRGFLVDIRLPWLSGLLGFEPDRVLMLTTSQAIGIVMAVGALLLHLTLRRRAERGVREALEGWRDLETEPGEGGEGAGDPGTG
ncbi:MAG: prolipoprotein diacylglyceryl transferase [Deltaproteobacteria bacterium]|nr:MAG: prolipoprotein diacylglyceryl transferase [Deltaproteobacteria bacterium]